MGPGPGRATATSAPTWSAASHPTCGRAFVWAGHHADPADVAALYTACDVLVLPSDREPWALVIHEAAAAGMAVVSSSAPGAAAELCGTASTAASSPLATGRR